MAISNGRVVVALGEHFALLGHSEPFPGNLHGQRKDGTSSRTTSATQRTPSTMKKQKSNVQLSCHFCQRSLRFVEIPVGGKVSTIFRAIGITDHNHLQRRLFGESVAVSSTGK